MAPPNSGSFNTFDTILVFRTIFHQNPTNINRSVKKIWQVVLRKVFLVAFGFCWGPLGSQVSDPPLGVEGGVGKRRKVDYKCGFEVYTTES